MFFDQMMGGPQFGGMAGPAALTSPGMNPNSLAALMAMQGRMGGGMAGGMPGGMGGPQLPPPPGGPAGGPHPGAPAQMPQNNTNLMQMLMQMDPNKLKGLASMLGLGGAGAAGAAGAGAAGPFGDGWSLAELGMAPR